MTVMQPPVTATPGAGSGPADEHRGGGWFGVTIVTALAALVAAGLIGYALGRPDTAGHVLVGRAWHSASQAAVRVDGWAYGFEINPNNDVMWYDAHGGLHDGGIAPCLRHQGYSWIRFGYSTAAGLHGDAWRPVDWVQCIQRP